MTLTQNQLEELTRAIQARRSALEAELDQDLSRGADASPEDIADGKRDAEELLQLEAAAARIAEGSYGDCVECAAHIPFARLRAAPHAARCVACQARVEKTHPATHPTL